MITIRLTLPDGTRTQLDAFEITDVEPVQGGSFIHRAAGEPIKILQDAKTIQTRINAELDAGSVESEDASIMDTATDVALTAVEPEHMIEPSRSSPAKPPTRLPRLKLFMEGQVSVMAIAIAQTRPV